MKSEGKGEMSKRGFSLGRIKSGLFIKNRWIFYAVKDLFSKNKEFD